MAEPAEQQARFILAEDVASRYALEQTRMSLEAGWLGKCFGSATNAPTNIAGLILFLFTATSIVALFLQIRMDVLDYLKLILPVITLVLGYLFGKST